MKPIGDPIETNNGRLRDASYATNRRLPATKIAVAFAVGALALAFTAPAAPAAPGDLDLGFHGDGVLTTAIGAGSAQDHGNDVLVQSDGKMLVAGHTGDGSNWDFQVSRYNPDGSPDPTFGEGDGVEITPTGPGDDYAFALMRQPDGKIVAAGQIGDDFGVVRYNPDGTLDYSLVGDSGNANGIVTVPVGPAGSRASDLARLPGGDIVVAGWADMGAATGRDFAVVRLNQDGTLDTGFDGDSGTGNGIVTVPVAPGDALDSAYAVALAPTTFITSDLIVAGRADMGPTGQDFAVVRLNPSGELVTSFDGDSSGDGKVTTSFGTSLDEAADVVVQPDGKLVAAGATGLGLSDWALARYNPDGTLDTGFSGDGKQTTSFDPEGTDSAHALVRQPDGKLVVGGRSGGYSGGVSTPTGADYALARYLPDGELDPGFSGHGKLTTAIAPGNGYDDVNGLALQPDGKLVATGLSNTQGPTGTDVSLARYYGGDQTPGLPVAPGQPTSGVPDTTRPSISSLSLSKRVFRVDRRARAAAVARRRRAAKGTSFRFRLSEAARVAFTIERRTLGRRIGKRCKKATRSNRSRRRCVRYLKLGSFARAGQVGRNSVRFSGRLKSGRRSRSLKTGRYRASLCATDAAGNRSKTKRVAFRIVR